ncbi:transcriptional repressor LexA [Candidatus Peregrinibacteria bacterium]|jgi:repressor LexA|nr:transcriptional repressor LexA [Candidatus Peregrinibacteria bacterium]MBT7703424.1 transcriptional repressor LexA [Candidatus Peregrinibacteria bacterium]
MEDLTKKQKKVLKFIEKYQWENGASPTIREMKERFEVSSDNSILKLLNALKKKGYIKKDDTPRGIKMLSSVRERMDAAAAIIRVPLVGTIPAGGPVAAEENTIETYEIGKGLMPSSKGAFLLRVTGNSMIDAGIYESDMVMVAPDQNVRSGDIVVALIDGENTVKTYINEKGKVYLQAENPEYENIYPTEELQIQGVVTGLIRNY